MIRRSRFRLFFVVSSSALFATLSSSGTEIFADSNVAAAVPAPKHERLRVTNAFKTPEEVLSYYCARDGEGFVWSGLTDAERTAFTTWSDAPQADSFYLAKSYKLKPTEKIGHVTDRVSIAVDYSLTAVSDGHGTRTPPSSDTLTVTFELSRVGTLWKIVKPDASNIAPVVMESRFPSAPPSGRIKTHATP